jgi:beta-fructofuranosidase
LLVYRTYLTFEGLCLTHALREQPNGPFYFNGVYHLFSQCRKMAAVMPIPPGGWCHYASRDLVKWRRLGYPLRPDHSYDNISLDTGSATIVDGVPTMIYPGIGKVTDSTVNDTCPSFRVKALRGPCRVWMSIAIPADLADPWLRVWTKPAANPLVDAPPSDIEAFWHDFSQAWQDESTGRWWAFAGAGWREKKEAPCPTCREGAPVPLCSCANGSFHDRGAWSCKPGDELGVATNTTAGLPAEVFAHSSWAGYSFSCPEFYSLPAPMPSMHRVLDNGKDHYWAGKYDEQTRRYDPTGFTALKYNYGPANAGKIFTHAESGRRLLWLWLHGDGGDGGCHATATEGATEDPSGVILCPAAKHAWDGVMSVPQEVRWDADAARLIITPARV